MTPESFVRSALRHVGAPYLWRGKGLDIWTPEGLRSNGLGVLAYDCSGLVTSALRDAGGPDWRASHSAQTLFDTLTPAPTADRFGVLRFYGASPTAVTHVAIGLGNGLVLEAAGGDSHTTSLQAARAANARVRVVLDGRTDLLGARLLP